MDDIIVDSHFADDQGEVMIVKLKGYIDQTNSFSLQKVFDDIFKSGCFKIVIDFSQVIYISSAGWGIFVGEIKRFRDNGGDIKLSSLNPDIYEVYQMLEFYHIFEDFPTVNEALKAINDSGGNELIENLTGNGNVEELEPEREEEKETEQPFETIEEDIVFEEEAELELDQPEAPAQPESVAPEEIFQTKTTDNREQMFINISRLPLTEKIKMVVSQYPLLGIWNIKKILQDQRFGSTKVSIFKLYKTLKELDLESKEKRYRFYRSC